MIEWNSIDNVFLDMDGTLLDLNFDTYFWTEHVPLRYAEKHHISVPEAKGRLFPRMHELQGTIDWYCIDHWSEELDLDIALLKEEVGHLIAVHPYVIEFLQAVRALGKRVLLVTNAHFKSIDLKMRRTPLGRHLDDVICSHEFRIPKEEAGFWHRLHARYPYDPDRTLLVDDSLPVLRAARDYGIAWLLAVHKPDTQRPERDVEEFAAIRSFRDILPGVEG